MIKHIFIVDISGMPIYARCVGHDACHLEKLDSLSVSGLLTALNNLAREFGGEDLQAIHMEKGKFLLATKNNFFVAFQIESNDELKKYQKHIDGLTNFVQSIYPKSTPPNKEDVLKIVSEVENFLKKSGLLEGQQDLLGKFKSKLFKN
ncbi:MAG: roadblock/LC7 domain-containing protein [Candidatus Jordarchaeaceae archaeon]